MLQKLKAYLQAHEKQYELLRYLIAGGLTTLLSMLVQYAGCFLLAQKEPLSGSVLAWVVASINRATGVHMMISATVSWIIAVLFAFWINRVMVFRVDSKEAAQIGKELLQFAASRLISFFLFEQGLMLVLKAMGITNMVNRVIVLVFVMIFNYVVSKFWIFKKKPTDGENAPQGL
ncbi:MAG: GtrA family protein [Clostridia bacterium]